MRILQILKKLNRREKIIVGASLGLLTVLVIVQLAVMPLLDRSRRLERKLRAEAVVLRDMQRLQIEYQNLRQNARLSSARFSHRQSGFTLFSFLDRLAGEAGIKDRINYMKPSKIVQKNSPYKISRVELKLNAITLEQLTNFLYGVETSQNWVNVAKLSISKKAKNQGRINVILQVETLEI